MLLLRQQYLTLSPIVIVRKKMYAINLAMLVTSCTRSVLVTAPRQLIVLYFVIGATIGGKLSDRDVAADRVHTLEESKCSGRHVGVLLVGHCRLRLTLGALCSSTYKASTTTGGCCSSRARRSA